MTEDGPTAASRGLASCHTCNKLVDARESACSRCGAAVHQRKSNSLQRTLALLITASILLVPANVYPIMITYQLGVKDESTILQGVVLLIQHGSVPIAAVIFIASVVVPLAKLGVMYYLVWSINGRPHENHRQRTRLFTAAEFIGNWSMVDIFVVAILVALIHLTGLLVISPGVATYSFTGVVLVTMVAAESFDTRLMWDQLDSKK